MGYRTWHMMGFQLTQCTRRIIFVSAGGEPQMCSLLCFLCAVFQQPASLCTSIKTRRWNSCAVTSTCALNVYFFSICMSSTRKTFCSARTQRSTKWNSFFVQTTYTSCRLLHRSTGVASVTFCLSASSSEKRTSGGPCCARQCRAFTAGSDLYATAWSREGKRRQQFSHITNLSGHYNSANEETCWDDRAMEQINSLSLRESRVSSAKVFRVIEIVLLFEFFQKDRKKSV